MSLHKRAQWSTKKYSQSNQGDKQLQNMMLGTKVQEMGFYSQNRLERTFVLLIESNTTLRK